MRNTLNNRDYRPEPEPEPFLATAVIRAQARRSRVSPGSTRRSLDGAVERSWASGVAREDAPATILPRHPWTSCVLWVEDERCLCSRVLAHACASCNREAVGGRPVQRRRPRVPRHERRPRRGSRDDSRGGSPPANPPTSPSCSTSPSCLFKLKTKKKKKNGRTFPRVAVSSLRRWEYHLVPTTVTRAGFEEGGHPRSGLAVWQRDSLLVSRTRISAIDAASKIGGDDWRSTQPLRWTRGRGVRPRVQRREGVHHGGARSRGRWTRPTSPSPPRRRAAPRELRSQLTTSISPSPSDWSTWTVASLATLRARRREGATPPRRGRSPQRDAERLSGGAAERRFRCGDFRGSEMGRGSGR